MMKKWMMKIQANTGRLLNSKVACANSVPKLKMRCVYFPEKARVSPPSRAYQLTKTSPLPCKIWRLKNVQLMISKVLKPTPLPVLAIKQCFPSQLSENPPTAPVAAVLPNATAPPNMTSPPRSPGANRTPPSPKRSLSSPESSLTCRRVI